MPLSILVLSRPARVARIVTLVGLAALLAGALAVGAQPLAARAAALALLTTAPVLGVLAPLYGRAAAIGLWTARAGIVLGAVALVLPDADATVALRLAAALVVVVGLRAIARGASRVGDLPGWCGAAVAAGLVAVLLAPGLGGAAVLGLAWLAVATAIARTAGGPRGAVAALSGASR